MLTLERQRAVIRAGSPDVSDMPSFVRELYHFLDERVNSDAGAAESGATVVAAAAAAPKKKSSKPQPCH